MTRTNFVTALSLVLVACGDSSSTPSAPPTPIAASASDAKTPPDAKAPPDAKSGTTTAVSNAPPTSTTTTAPTAATTTAPPIKIGTTPPSKWDGASFTVHEWGTDTVVSASDGTLLPGLHHEEEDLPGFVYDRVKSGGLPESYAFFEAKMETPVTYFYSPTEKSVTVDVGFPEGVLTQWYPAVTGFAPKLAHGDEFGAPGTVLDPALDVDFPFLSATCRTSLAPVTNGELNWGNVDILPRDAVPNLEPAPIDAYTWAYARQTDANAIRTHNLATASGSFANEDEKFLFYRGLGNLPLPVTVTAHGDGAIAIDQAADADPVGAVFVLNVDANYGGFTEYPSGLGGPRLETNIPLLGDLNLDSFVTALGASMQRALVAAGLYDDEAAAMIATWKRQWFRTPGARVLYLAPRSFTDAQIPLTVTPAPDAAVRVMMLRVEVLTPELEAADVAEMPLFPTDGGTSPYFDALGRFEEPRLRRAMQLFGATTAGTSKLGTASLGAAGAYITALKRKDTSSAFW